MTIFELKQKQIQIQIQIQTNTQKKDYIKIRSWPGSCRQGNELKHRSEIRSRNSREKGSAINELESHIEEQWRRIVAISRVSGIERGENWEIKRTELKEIGITREWVKYEIEWKDNSCLSNYYPFLILV